MITYFNKNKGTFRICEDSLSSTVFDLLKYLPSDVFWNILKKSLYHQKLPETCGEIIEFSFWTKWSVDETQQNERYIEPDIFIRFIDFDLIIEAKRYDENQQRSQQMTDEIKSYFIEFNNDDKNLYFIQLGGLNSTFDEEDKIYNEKKIVICKTNWTKLLDQIVSEIKKIEDINYSQINSYKRIFEDLIKGFEMHGFYRKVWLDSLFTIQLNTNNIDKLFSYAKQY